MLPFAVSRRPARVLLAWLALGASGICVHAQAQQKSRTEAQALHLSVDETTGSYAIADGAGTPASQTRPVLRARVAARVNGRWLHASDYPTHTATRQTAAGELGAAEEWTLRYTGRADAPDLLVHLRTYEAVPFGDVQVTLHNTTGSPLTVESIRVIEASAAAPAPATRGKATGAAAPGPLLDLGGPASADRVLSDSFSEDRPAMQLRDLGDAEKQVHRAVGSQLLYNRQSGRSFFIGALTSDKFLSVLRLHMAAADKNSIASYEVDSTGTTELLTENSLATSSADDRVELSLPVAPGAELQSERMLFSVSNDYHKQLETYAHLVRDLHHARVSAPTPLGWWSWTAFYFGLSEATALTNAQWLAQHLESFGYTFFHMDEGYQFARGEYGTPDASLFPHGIAALERKVTTLGLLPGIWTAPFEVSERSWVYANHPEWLVHNAKGAPIHIGAVDDGKDRLYALDPTHPGAQGYLRETYARLTQQWGIRYIKMDFMEDSAIEGVYHQPNITALEAQRIGLKTIREAVGEEVLLDKDGCELLNPVGYVDMGRISQDTGHTFSSSKDAAPGIAARYYMNRNYFLADPDAFTVSPQVIEDQDWHGGSRALTLDEARVSIALTAVSGGLFEIGDALPALEGQVDRVALLTNRTLLDMAHLGVASTPLDLMTYQAEDLQPSVFLLKEDARQSIVTIFNWTEGPRTHRVSAADLGLDPKGTYTMTDALGTEAAKAMQGPIEIEQPAHSVRLLRVVNTSVAATPPQATPTLPSDGKAGANLSFSAAPSTTGQAIAGYRWDFGDGVAVSGRAVTHAYTNPGNYTVTLTATGLEGVVGPPSSSVVKVTGVIPTRFRPEAQRRLEGPMQ